MSQNLLQKKGFLVAAVAAINIIVFFVGGWWLTSAIVAASRQINEKEASISDIYQNWQQLGHSQKELQQMEGDLARIDGAFVPLKQPIEFIKTLEELAKKSGSLYEINLLPLVPEGEVNTLSLQIYLAGSFDSLMHFLVYLENMQYYVRPDSIQISAMNLGAKPSRDAWSEADWKAIGSGGVFSVINLKALTQ